MEDKGAASVSRTQYSDQKRVLGERPSFRCLMFRETDDSRMHSERYNVVRRSVEAKGSLCTHAEFGVH